ncbi:hypothetical protein C2S52_006047 [Perilla frutescens var. hirtella]|nr:hypothetical protein C2S52_006047 [Perilla frutescens var. hirtella]
MHRPVILPLQRAGGLRCSVKPAWRGALLSKSHEARAFARTTWPNSQLGTGGPELALPKPSQLVRPNIQSS